MPRIIEVEGAVSSIPPAGMVVAQRVADVIACPLITLWNLTAYLHFRRRSDVPTKTTNEGVIKDVTQEAIEIAWAATLEEGCLQCDLTGSTIVAGI